MTSATLIDPASSLNSVSTIVHTMNAAERELATFLLAVKKTLGAGSVERAGVLWIERLEAADEICGDAQKYLRQISIRAAAQLAIDLHTIQVPEMAHS